MHLTHSSHTPPHDLTQQIAVPRPAPPALYLPLGQAINLRCRSLCVLQLAGLRLGAEGAAALSAVMFCPMVHTLDLSSNLLGDDGIDRVSLAIQRGCR